MTVHLVNPSHLSFGVGVITPRWSFVLGAATPGSYGTPLITDETLEPFDLGTVQPGDVVSVGIHSGMHFADTNSAPSRGPEGQW